MWLVIYCFLCNLKSFSIVTANARIHRFNRVRRLAFDIEPSIAFDMEIVLPFPMFKGVEIAAVIDVPFVIHLQQDVNQAQNSNDASMKNYHIEPMMMMPAPGLDAANGGSGDDGEGDEEGGKSAADESNMMITKQAGNIRYPTFIPAYYDGEANMNRSEQPRIVDNRRRYYYDHYRRSKRHLRLFAGEHRHEIYKSFSDSLSR